MNAAISQVVYGKCSHSIAHAEGVWCAMVKPTSDIKIRYFCWTENKVVNQFIFSSYTITAHTRSTYGLVMWRRNLCCFPHILSSSIASYWSKVFRIECKTFIKASHTLQAEKKIKRFHSMNMKLNVEGVSSGRPGDGIKLEIGHNYISSRGRRFLSINLLPFYKINELLLCIWMQMGYSLFKDSDLVLGEWC